MLGDLANWVDFLNSRRSKLNRGSEELNTLVLVERALDERGLNDTLLALCSLEEALRKAGTCHSHRESGRSGTTLCLDDLVTTELDTLNVGVTLGTFEVVTSLGEERNDSRTGVTTNDCDVLGGRVSALDLRDEARRADNIEGGDTEEALGVVDTLRLEDLSSDGNGRVDLDHVNCVQRVNNVTVLTGLAMMRMLASGQVSAQAAARSRTMEAFVLKRSSRVMPGLRGTPAGMRTISAPVRHSLS